MPISSLIVRTKSERTQNVASSIGEITGAEVSRIEAESIVVITDTRDQHQDRRIWDAIEAMPGVIGVNLIYHNFEDLENESDKTQNT